MIDTFTITIPWPGKYNNPNSRPPHWAVKASHVSQARRDSFLACAAHPKRPIGWTRARVNVTAYHKTRRFKDPQNIIAALKASIDGIEDAGVIENDNGLEWGPVTRLKDRDNPRVVLEFVWIGGKDA